jgi:hypothetical protein
MANAEGAGKSVCVRNALAGTSSGKCFAGALLPSPPDNEICVEMNI